MICRRLSSATTSNRRNWNPPKPAPNGSCTWTLLRTGNKRFRASGSRSKTSKAPSGMPRIPGPRKEINNMRRNERGIALLLCLFSLMLLTGIGIGLLYMTDAETQINANYRSSQQAYFAAMAGLQNVRERMTPANTGSHALVLPTVMPGTAGSILYVTNPSGGSDVVAPSTSGNAYYDNEICSELTALNVSCSLQSSSTTTTGENGPPYLNTTGALPYKWVRIVMKANGSGAPYYTNSAVAANNQVCWNGTSEIPVSTLGIANCNVGGSAGHAAPQTPIYQLTSYAVTPSGASRTLQMEVALDPPIL